VQLFLVGRLFELRLDVPHAALDAAHLAGTRQHLCQHAPAATLGHLLAQVADDRLPGARDRSGVRVLVAGDQLEQRGLAGAIGADDGDATPGTDHQADIAEQVLRGVPLRHARDRHEAHGR
jgi:hypothetical protein